MAKDITFSAATDFYRAERRERKASLLQRVSHWLASVRNARAEREIERYINAHGGVLTDNIEREIAQRFADGKPGRF